MIIVYTSIMYSQPLVCLLMLKGFWLLLPLCLCLLIWVCWDSVDLMRSASDVCRSVRLCVLWERPSEGWYKLNTDAAVDRAGGFWCSDS